MKGWVYFARFGASGPIKIGSALDVHARMRDLAVGSPVKIELIGVLLCGDAKSEEKRLQTKLHSHRIRGEWFEADAVLAEMQRLPVVAPEQSFKIKSSRETLTGVLHFRASVEEVAAWRAAARRSRISLSAWLRRLGNADATQSVKEAS